MSLPDAGSEPSDEVPASVDAQPAEAAEPADEAPVEAIEPLPALDVVPEETAAGQPAEQAPEEAPEPGEAQHVRLRRELTGQLAALSGAGAAPLAEQAAAFERLHQDLTSALARIEGV
jgi:hypothetical protein